jgi:hypothetical protein
MHVKLALAVVTLAVTLAVVAGLLASRQPPPAPRFASDAELAALLGCDETQVRKRLGEPDFVSPPSEEGIVLSYHQEDGSPLLVHVSGGKATRVSRLENGKLKSLGRN